MEKVGVSVNLLGQKVGVGVKKCSDATAVVKDQDGNILATESIASGVSKDINVNAGEIEILYTYNYPALNTGQDVSYATGDDKWVRDNVFNPEVATWGTNLKWVFPVLDPNDPTLLQFGSNPDGSGNNIFGNKNRFTDENGLQVYGVGYYIDHYTGLAHYFGESDILWQTYLDNAISSNFNGKNDWFGTNFKMFIALANYIVGSDARSLFYAPFNSLSSNFHTSNTNRDVSTRLVRYGIRSNIIDVNRKDITNLSPFYTRKAFTYNPTTKQMELN